MIRRADLPDAIPRRSREALAWFLENFQVRFISAVHWDNLSPWFKERRKITDNFLLFPAHRIFAATDDESRTIGPGEFFAIPEGVWHGYGLKPGMRRSVSVMVHLQFETKLHVNPLGIFPSVFHRLPRPDTYGRLRALSCLALHSTVAARRAGDALFTQLMIDLILAEARTLALPQTYFDERIARATRYVDEHLDRDIGVEDMAAQAGVGLVRFRQLFRRQTGVSPRAYLVDARVKRAAGLLVSGDQTLAGIARSTGFANAFYFSNAFKRATGLRPSQFRLRDGQA